MMCSIAGHFSREQLARRHFALESSRSNPRLKGGCQVKEEKPKKPEAKSMMEALMAAAESSKVT